MQTNPVIEQSKIIRWSESLWNQSGRHTAVKSKSSSYKLRLSVMIVKTRITTVKQFVLSN